MYADFNFWITLLIIVVVMGVIQGTCAYLVLLERKIAAWTQDRIGPNRAGPLGLLQPIADGLKFVFKEQLVPAKVDKLFYLLAPAVAMTAATLAFAVVPFGRTSAPPSYPWPQKVDEQTARDNDPDFQKKLADYNSASQVHVSAVQWVIAPHVEVGVVYVFAVGSLAVYAVVLGGWSSNSKYSFLGALRSSAQLISYEIPLGMSILGVVIMSGSLNLERIIE